MIRYCYVRTLCAIVFQLKTIIIVNKRERKYHVRRAEISNNHYGTALVPIQYNNFLSDRVLI